MFTHSALAQAGKFGVVGVINTLIDFAIFNLLTSKLFRIHKIPANICSTTIAMVFSFFANRQAVFTSGTGDPALQAILFFVTTGFGLYVLQNGILYLLLIRWQWPRRFTGVSLRVIGWYSANATDFMLKNGAKALGTIVSLIWNFVLYKYVVFR